MQKETLDYRAEYERANSVGGLFDLREWDTVSVAGPDTLDFLQRLTTLDFRNPAVGNVRLGAVLTGRGLVVAFGYFWVVSSGEVRVFLENGFGERLAAHLEALHFAENLTVTAGKARVSSEAKDESGLWGLWTAKKDSPLSLAEGVAWQDAYRPHLQFVWGGRPALFASHANLSPRLFEYFRMASGLGRLGCEITDREIVLEASLDAAVARNKGCYPGQEVVERIFTYGSVNRKLLRVSLPDLQQDYLAGSPLPLGVEEPPAGFLVSAIMNPIPGAPGIGLAYLRKAFWQHSDALVLREGLGGAKVFLWHDNSLGSSPL